MSYWLVNTLIFLLVLVVVRSGFRGEAALVKTGGWIVAPLIILGVSYAHGWGGAIIWLAAMFIGHVITTIKAVVKEERQIGLEDEENQGADKKGATE